MSNFDSKGYLIKVNSDEEMEDAIKRVKKFKPNKWEFNNDKFIERLEEYIDNN